MARPAGYSGEASWSPGGLHGDGRTPYALRQNYVAEGRGGAGGGWPSEPGHRGRLQVGPGSPEPWRSLRRCPSVVVLLAIRGPEYGGGNGLLVLQGGPTAARRFEGCLSPVPE